MNKRFQIGIMGASEADATLQTLAEQAGRAVAAVGAALVTGGRGGIMEAASRGCAQAGGTVIAVTPYTDMYQVNQWVHYVIPTGMGWARNCISAISGDVIILIGGAAGTLSEAAFAWVYNRPVVALTQSGGWAAKLAGERIDHRREDVIVDCSDITQLESILKTQLARIKVPDGPPRWE